MTVPTTEASIYASPVRSAISRVIMGLDYPCWTADFDDLFDAQLDPANYRFSQQSGSPLVEGGVLKLRSFGIPPFEYVQTRTKLVPRDPTQSFQIRFTARWTTNDPIYSIGITVGGIDGQFGPGSDIKLIQNGSGVNPNYPGRIVIYPPGSFPGIDTLSDFVFDNDQIAREFKIEWDVADVNPLKMYINDVLLFETTGPKPYYVTFGTEWTTTVEDAALGGVEPGDVTLLEVAELHIEEFGTEGHETRVYPAWSTPNDDATSPDDADDGERYVDDNTTWAIIPQHNTVNWIVEDGLSQQAATFNLTLVPDISDLDDIAWPHYEGRDILIDTKVDAATWKRHIAGKIESQTWEVSSSGVPRLTLSGRCRVMKKLDDTVSLTVVKSDSELAGIPSISFQELFEYVLDIADSLAGDVLGLIQHDVNAPIIIPEALSDGGYNLLSNWNDWIDRLVQESRVIYGTSGATKYGQVRTNLWDTIPGTPYAFTLANVIRAKISDDTRNGPGRISYHPNLTRAQLLNQLTIPGQGHAGYTSYPAWPYPEHRRTFSDSIAYANEFAIDNTVSFPDRSDSAQFGGIAKLRWYAEISRQRTLSISARNHDWVEPGDPISFDATALAAGAQETWIVDRVKMAGDVDGVDVEIDAFSTDIVGNVTRGGNA